MCLLQCVSCLLANFVHFKKRSDVHDVKKIGPFGYKMSMSSEVAVISTNAIIILNWQPNKITRSERGEVVYFDLLSSCKVDRSTQLIART